MRELTGGELFFLKKIDTQPDVQSSSSRAIVTTELLECFLLMRVLAGGEIFLSP